MNILKRIVGWIYRSAITGKFVSKQYAENHPETTTRERKRP